MILEALVTTCGEDGSLHLAPMGPRVEPIMTTFLLRPFPTSQTFRNLRRNGEGVLHVTDDVLLLAKAALGRVEPLPRHHMAVAVVGYILPDACRAYEFVVRSIDESKERMEILAQVVQAHRFRDFFGFNRAKHAVIEAAILATRVDFLPLDDIRAEFDRLEVLIQKTGGRSEEEAFSFLKAFLNETTKRQEFEREGRR